MQLASILLKNLHKRYENGFHAVNDVNLEVAHGELLVLVGPSGCGKSTTLRLLAGLEEISSGEVSIGDRLVNDLAPADRNIAMVFQNYALYPHMTVRENMAFGLKMRKMPADEINQRVVNAAEILTITDLLDRRPREMSGGQRQRVALGRAIVRDPDVFLFDEPLSNLDAKLRVQMRTEISRLHQRLGATMVYVTHDQVEAMTLGDRIVVMRDGVIQQVAGPLELYNHPLNQFVAGFIGSPAMNFFKGQLKDGIFKGHGLTLDLKIFSKNIADQSLVLGIRPEDLLVDPKLAAFGEIEVDVVEHMGHESLVYFNLNDTQAVARLNADQNIRPAEKIILNLNPESLHLFEDSVSGKRLN
jgi:multiple sugar transport system ATP-binding protein